jgi:hypothetical protein
VGCIYGQILGVTGGWGFLVILDLRWVRVPKLNFGMTCGVGMMLLGCFSKFIQHLS